MAFVKVVKDSMVRPLMVPKKALPQYLNAGWRVEGSKTNASKKNKTVVDVEPITDVEEEVEGSVDSDDSEWDDSEWDEEAEEETSRLEELEEKPLSEMNNKELKEYAELKGINIEGLSSNKQLREAISAASR